MVFPFTFFSYHLLQFSLSLLGTAVQPPGLITHPLHRLACCKENCSLWFFFKEQGASRLGPLRRGGLLRKFFGKESGSGRLLHVICLIKEHFIPDRIWSVFGGYWFIFHNWPYDPPSTEMIKPTLSLQWFPLDIASLCFKIFWSPFDHFII